MAWTEIGKRLGISECRVRQIHAVALQKLRKAIEDENLADELLTEIDTRRSDRDFRRVLRIVKP